MTPTQRTIRALKDRGLKCAIVEKFNAHIGPHGVRQDMFGIIDIIALDPESGVIGIQSCGNSYAAHLRKLKEERAQECLDWLSTPGCTLELWSWSKRKRKLDKGWSKAYFWTPKAKQIKKEDILKIPTL